MRRDFHRRLARLEIERRVGKSMVEVWLDKGDGYLRKNDGTKMTRKAFDAAFPNAREITLDISEKD
jgi:hypothetical protein